jgi:MoxR-like ATPase
MLLATQNPTTDLGTYAQSVALGDRFGISILVNHANQETETAILDLILNERRAKFKNQTNSSDTNTDSAIDLTNPQTPVENKFTLADILEAQEEVINVHVSKEVARYITLITDITRTPSTYTNGPSSSSLKHISEGISFRGTQAMLFGAQAVAWLDGRNTVEIQDVDAIVKDVLRHRLKIDEVARIESLNVDSIIEQLTIVASRKINENP